MTWSSKDDAVARLDAESKTSTLKACCLQAQSVFDCIALSDETLPEPPYVVTLVEVMGDAV